MFRKKKNDEGIEKMSVPEPDFDACLKAAFGLVVAEIESADDIPVATLFNAVSAHHGDTRNQAKALLQCFNGRDWKWPLYESYTQAQHDSMLQARMSEIEGYDLKGLLSNFTVSRLQETYSKCLGERPKSSLRKQKLIGEIVKVANHDFLVSIRNELITSLRKPLAIDKKSMAETLARRIDTLAYAFYRKQQMLEVAEYRPFWEFMTIMDSLTPAECQLLHGTIRHYTDPFWEEHYPPCWRPDCRCYVKSHSEFSLETRAKKPH